MSRKSTLLVGLRPWSEDDLPLLGRLLGDPAMTEFIGGPESPEQLAKRHRRYLDPESAPNDHVFAIVVGANREAVGWVGYWESEWMGTTVWETGWHVLPEFQRRGVASAAAALALDSARKAGLHRYVHAFPSTDNMASNGVCRALGFTNRGAVEVEYPPGHMMLGNDWSLDLERSRPG